MAGRTHAAGRRRAHRQGGQLPSPRRAGARGTTVGTLDAIDALLARHDGAAPHRLPRRPAALAPRPCTGHARRRRTLARAHGATGAGAGARQPRRPCRRPAAVLGRALRRRAVPPAAAPRLALCHHPRALAAAMCWPAICTRASPSAAASTGCACRVSTSAPTSACCRRSAPSPACTRSTGRRGDRVFVVADNAVHEMAMNESKPLRRILDRARRRAAGAPGRRAAARGRRRRTGRRRSPFATASAAASARSSRCATWRRSAWPT